MSQIDYADIEIAILTRLFSASKAGILGYQLRTIESYAGQLDDEDAFAQFGGQFPAALVSFGGANPAAVLGNGWRMRARFSVLAVSTRLMNDRAARFGCGGDYVGAYQIGRDIKDLLAGQSLGLPLIGGLVPAGTQLLLNTTTARLSLAVLSVEFTADYADATKGIDLPHAGLVPLVGDATCPNGSALADALTAEVPTFPPDVQGVQAAFEYVAGKPLTEMSVSWPSLPYNINFIHKFKE